MKGAILALAASFAAQAFAAACPFGELHAAGKLNEDEAAKYAAVKRDPAEAERLYAEHQEKKRNGAYNFPQHPPDKLVGPRDANGLLDLPLGGGLLNGRFQPLTGGLKLIKLPRVLPQGLKKIGDEPGHKFQKPGPTDVRGMCPTLNTLANHGYISRDGITNFAEASEAVQEGYGFDFILSTFLSAVGLLAAGDLPSGIYSIGGADDRVPNSIGQAQGLDSHGVFEIDGSMTRQDGYFGSNSNFYIDRWHQLVKTTKKHGGLFGFPTMAEDNGNRYDNSRKNNPEAFFGAVWFIVSHAERVFVYEGLPNGTTLNKADYKNIAPFFLDEEFPPNWFRRGHPFTLPQAFAEAGQMFAHTPRELGANMGKGNFVPLGVDPSSKTPAQIGCFILENILDLSPGQIQPQFKARPDLFEGFAKGIIAPMFIEDGFFNCPLTEFTKPSVNAGATPKGKSASGSPKNGCYEGLGCLKSKQPGSQG